VGKPDAYAGELPVAYVQLREQTTAGEDELRSFVRDRISDPVAVPRNIYITEQMPLTDVRKIAKPLLRLDCARLTFLDALRPVIPAGAELEVRVEPHRQHGTLTTVELRRVAGDRGSLARQITDVMQAYAFPFEISWS
jgi:fatty-acyl-CoA synthase